MEEESNEFAIRGSTSRQNIEAKAQRYTESAQSLLDDLQTLCRGLEGQIKTAVNIVPFGGSDYPFWSNTGFDYAGATNTASETYEAWLIARRSNKVVAEFDGKSLQAFVSLFTRLHYQPMASDGFPEAGTIEAAENLMTAVYRLELLLLLKPRRDTEKTYEPTEAQIKRVTDAIAGMLVKDAGVKAIARIAKMRPARVSIILKKLKHQAE